MAARSKAGDKVAQSTSPRKTKGVVKKTTAAPTKAKAREAAASKKEEDRLSERARSGRKAARKPESLKKTSAGKTKVSTSAAKKAAPKKTAAPKSKTGTGTARKTPKRPAAGPSPVNTARKSSGKAASTKGTNAGVKRKAAKKAPSKAAAGTSRTSSGKTVRQGARKKAEAKPAAPARITKKDDDAIKNFRKMVNLSADQLKRWLDTKDSKKVGVRDAGKSGTAGNESGRRILKIMAKRRDRYTDEDVSHIHEVVGHIRRRLAQKPPGDFRASNWRYSLMNWGHDPAK